MVATRLGLHWIMLDNRWLTLLQDDEMRRVVPLCVLDPMVPGNLYQQDNDCLCFVVLAMSGLALVREDPS
jgi:hypothetical protein